MQIKKIFYDLINFGLKTLIFKFLSKAKGQQFYNYSLKGILLDSKHMSEITLIDRYERYLRVLKTNSDDFPIESLNFKNKNIFELGCGPLLGWGPLSIYKGAQTFCYDEPFLKKDILKSQILRDKYFKPLFEELKNNYKNNIDFDTFYKSIFEKSMEKNKKENSFDLIISNSVLEHIPKVKLESILEDLFNQHKKGGYFLHAVDFGAHGYGGQGFGKLYKKNKYHVEKKINSLNLYRPSEIYYLLKKVGWKIITNFTYKKLDVDNKKIHYSWENYSNDDLSSKTVLIFGKK